MDGKVRRNNNDTPKLHAKPRTAPQPPPAVQMYAGPHLRHAQPLGRLAHLRLELGLRAVQISPQLAHQPRVLAVRDAQHGQRPPPALHRGRELLRVRLQRKA